MMTHEMSKHANKIKKCLFKKINNVFLMLVNNNKNNNNIYSG